MKLFDDVVTDRPEDAPVLTLDYLESLVKKLRSSTAGLPIAPLQYSRGADGLWYVFDQTGAVVFVADDIGYTQLTGEEPPA